MALTSFLKIESAFAETLCLAFAGFKPRDVVENHVLDTKIPRKPKYLLKTESRIMALNLIIHYDPAIFGEDTGLFRCDCFLITDPDSGKPPTLLNDGKLIDPFTVFGRRNHSCPRTSIPLQ